MKQYNQELCISSNSRCFTMRLQSRPLNWPEQFVIITLFIFCLIWFRIWCELRYPHLKQNYKHWLCFIRFFRSTRRRENEKDVLSMRNHASLSLSLSLLVFVLQIIFASLLKHVFWFCHIFSEDGTEATLACSIKNKTKMWNKLEEILLHVTQRVFHHQAPTVTSIN